MSPKQPLPWTYEQISTGTKFSWTIQDASGFTVANDLEEENARYIVHAVNACEKLAEYVSACRYLGRDGVDLAKEEAMQIYRSL